MDFINSLLFILTCDFMTDLYIELGTNLSWRLIRKLITKKDSFELQAYAAINDTFIEFYSVKQFEYDEDIVMTSFIQNVNKGISEINFESITLSIISETTGQKLEEEDYIKWTQIFKTICSHPKYRWLYNRIMFDKYHPSPINRDNSWMKEYMIDNCCKLSLYELELFPRIFDDIQTTLSDECWYDTQVLLYEILYNAQKHGEATNCKLKIKSSSISIYDDGTPFNPKSLLNQKRLSGGVIAINQYIIEHPETSLIYEYENGNNIFVLSFNQNVFDINIMSEIIVPTFFHAQFLYRLKYNNSVFKYYYIDIDEVASLANGMLIASYSGIIELFLGLYNTLIKHMQEKKIFIYFSNMGIPEYRKVYEMMNSILDEAPELDTSIQLITSNS